MAWAEAWPDPPPVGPRGPLGPPVSPATTFTYERTSERRKLVVTSGNHSHSGGHSHSVSFGTNDTQSDTLSALGRMLEQNATGSSRSMGVLA